jgi:hypothetical protein
VCANVGPHGWEVELVRASARQGPMRPPRGEPWAGEGWKWDKVGASSDDDERAGRRHRYDDPSAGSSHASSAGTDGEFEDFLCQLEGFYRECLRECGLKSKMRESWRNLWAFRQSRRP